MQDSREPRNWSLPFRIGDFLVDPGANRISGPETDRHIEPKAMQVLCVLASRQGQTVRRDELLESVWAGRVVVDETLTRAVSLLRQVLTDGTSKSGYIQTVPKQGYRLLAAVSEVEALVPVAATDTAKGPVLDELAEPFTSAKHVKSASSTTESTSATQGRARNISEDMPDETADLLVPKPGPKNRSKSPRRRWSLALALLLISVGGALVYWLELGAGTATNDRASDSTAEALLRPLEGMPAGETGGDVGSARTGNLRSNNMDAQSLYQQARYWWMNGTTANWFYQARDSLEQAIALDPNFAKAHASLAYIYARHDFHDQYMASDVSRKRAAEEIRLALALDDASVDAYLAQAILATSANDFMTARAAIDRAMELQPSNPVSHYLDSELQLARNEPDLALNAAERALQLDPLSVWVNVNMGIVRYYRGEYAEAAQALDNAIRIDEEYPWAYVWRAMVQHAKGQLADAVMTMRHCLELDPASETNAEFLGLLYLDLMDEAQARYWFEYAASLQGDGKSARLWDRMVSLAYKRSDDELLLALAGNALGELHNSRFSLVPIVSSALVALGRQGEAGDWLTSMLSGGDVVAGPAPNGRGGEAHVQPQDGDIALGLAIADESRRLREAVAESLTAFPSYYRHRGLEAQWYLMSGQRTEALTSLSRALNEGWLLHRWMLPQMLSFDGIRQAPEFQKLMARAEAHAKVEFEKLARLVHE